MLVLRSLNGTLLYFGKHATHFCYDKTLLLSDSLGSKQKAIIEKSRTKCKTAEQFDSFIVCFMQSRGGCWMFTGTLRRNLCLVFMPLLLCLIATAHSILKSTLQLSERAFQYWGEIPFNLCLFWSESEFEKIQSKPPPPVTFLVTVLKTVSK